MKKFKSVICASILILGGIGTLSIYGNDSIAYARNTCKEVAIDFAFLGILGCIRGSIIVPSMVEVMSFSFLDAMEITLGLMAPGI